jgi:RHS repeat-associated protein
LIAAQKKGSTVLEQMSYDPLGRKHNGENWLDYENTNTPFTSLYKRGYTGHEHIDAFGLINMNGRMYDARLGRFLSPDPFVQAPDNSQSFNRYSYCVNNPMKYKDPSGEFFIGTLLTGVIDFLKTVFVKGGIDPWNTSANRRAAWRDFDPTASCQRQIRLLRLIWVDLKQMNPKVM